MFAWVKTLFSRGTPLRPKPLPEIDITLLGDRRAPRAVPPVGATVYIHKPLRRREAPPATPLRAQAAARPTGSADADIPIPAWAWPFMADSDRGDTAPCECPPPERAADIEPPAISSGGGGDFAGGGSDGTY